MENFSYMEGSQKANPISFSQTALSENHPTSGAVWGATNIDNSTTVNFDQGEAEKANLSIDFDQIMDPKKLRRMLSNRLSAQRSRQKKSQYLANLESKAKAIEHEIADIQSQIASQLNRKSTLLLERETLGHQVTILQNKTFLKNVTLSAQIEKRKVEVNTLRKIHSMQQEQLKENMLNWNTNVQQIPNDPISNHYSNPFQEPTQSQKWIPGPGVPDENEMNLTLPNSKHGIDGDESYKPKGSEF